MSGLRLTEIAHREVSLVLQPGENAIDATMGRGHDTLFLAQALGPDGHVIALDVQPEALAATQTRLDRAGVLDRTELILRSHAELKTVHRDSGLPPSAAVMFNLGYLPRADHQLRTTTESTLKALEDAQDCLRAEGILSVLCYRGHSGGAEEFSAVSNWMESQPGTEQRFQNPDDDLSPVLILKRGCR